MRKNITTLNTPPTRRDTTAAAPGFPSLSSSMNQFGATVRSGAPAGSVCMSYVELKTSHHVSSSNALVMRYHSSNLTKSRPIDRIPQIMIQPIPNIPTIQIISNVSILEPLGDVECNVSSSFVGTHFAFSEDFAPFSILFVDCIGSIEGVFLHQDAILTSTDGTGESGGHCLQCRLTHRLFRRFSHVLHPSLSSRRYRTSSPTALRVRGARPRSVSLQ